MQEKNIRQEIQKVLNGMSSKTTHHKGGAARAMK
jgi:hypothetical protein